MQQFQIWPPTLSKSRLSLLSLGLIKTQALICQELADSPKILALTYRSVSEPLYVPSTETYIDLNCVREIRDSFHKTF